MPKKLAILSGAALLLAGACMCAVLCAPQALGLSAYLVRTGSMEPYLMPGDTAYVAGLEPGTGDVAAYYDGDGDLVLHRVEAVSGDGIVTKGDANPVRDAGAVPSAAVGGQVVFRLPGGSMTDVLLAAMSVSSLCAGTALSAMGIAMRGTKKGARYETDD